jgi:IS5 family transposase
MNHFRPIDRETGYLLPPSVQGWLPEAHLARYVVDVVEVLDLSELKAKEEATGKKSGGKPLRPPRAGPRPEEQINLTDEESRIMKVAGGGFDQCYNAQGAVDTETMLIVAPHVTQAGNDKEQVEPRVEKIQSLPEGLNQPKTLLADTGYYSEKNVEVCHAAGIRPLIAVGRDEHHPHWRKRFEGEAAPAALASHVEQMKHALRTKAGRAAYALRKQTVEPVFGILKSVMGFRQFLLRGLENVRHEWTLACFAWNLKQMAVLRPR